MNPFRIFQARNDAPEDAEFMADVKAALHSHTRPLTNVSLYVLMAFIGVGVYWAANAPLDVVTVGQGKVIPSSKVQVIENLEGGILEELLVKEGALVEKGQVLAKINDVRFTASYREDRAQYLALRAGIARLTAEVGGVPLDFPPDVKKERPDLVKVETELYLSRRKELDNTLDVLKRSHEMVSRELEMSIPLVAQGAMSEVEILRLKRQENELRGQIDDKRNKFASEAQGELNRTKVGLDKLTESTVANKDRVTRTFVRSPLQGVVKKINKTTIGGVIGPGEDIMEVVPLEDSLLIETQIKPDDIGFVRTGQHALVKVSAYDFSIYGGLPGIVEHVSADALADEKRPEITYYKALVRTKSNVLLWQGRSLLIIPGMTATVDVLTDHRTVMYYLLKPILKTQEKALRER